eukprot:CAMPEP_0195272198 /NCGR_PEP_ID=MMETSP0706-20130129/15616_1 /TAXON_ID=33640 /ORGANISM="Asterionellopsis glacialis, Strain CCMP134" /LENGTH=49 /DNA_ID= /DNA_START= /DNA_END= /DNA_ORIENTATION=
MTPNNNRELPRCRISSKDASSNELDSTSVNDTHIWNNFSDPLKNFSLDA